MVDLLKGSILKHYNEVSREQSSPGVTQLRKINNYAKTVLFSTFSRKLGEYPSVLDMSCGRGGDIGKWEKRGYKRYVGFDISPDSIQEAKKRWNEMKNRIEDSTFLVADFCDNNLQNILGKEKFDCVSCQFAAHYAFYSTKSVFIFLKNVTNLLKPGGTFLSIYTNGYSIMNKVLSQGTTRLGNSLYNLTINTDISSYQLYSSMEWIRPGGVTYTFSLDGCVNNCPEFMACIDDSQSGYTNYIDTIGLKRIYGNKIRFMCDRFGNDELARKMGVCNEFVNRRLWNKIHDILEVSDIYTVCVFQKGGSVFEPQSFEEPQTKRRKSLNDFISVQDTPLQYFEGQKQRGDLQEEQGGSVGKTDSDLQTHPQASQKYQHSNDS